MSENEKSSALTMFRRKRVSAESGLSNSGLYDHIAKGLYTAPVKISVRCSAWPAGEVEAINAARIAGKSDDELRKLVRTLHAQRVAIGRSELLAGRP